MEDKPIITMTVEDYVKSIGRLAAHIENVDIKLDRIIAMLEKHLQEKANG